MRIFLILLAASIALATPSLAKKVKFGGGPVEFDWDPKIRPGDPGTMSIQEFFAAGYGPLKTRKPGVGNGGRDEDYINGNQVR
jgi:hypothetical protein